MLSSRASDLKYGFALFSLAWRRCRGRDAFCPPARGISLLSACKIPLYLSLLLMLARRCLSAGRSPSGLPRATSILLCSLGTATLNARACTRNDACAALALTALRCALRVALPALHHYACCACLRGVLFHSPYWPPRGTDAGSISPPSRNAADNAPLQRQPALYLKASRTRLPFPANWTPSRGYLARVRNILHHSTA